MSNMDYELRCRDVAGEAKAAQPGEGQLQGPLWVVLERSMQPHL